VTALEHPETVAHDAGVRRSALRSALPPWIVARVLVLGAWLAARVARDHGWVHDPLARSTIHHGLLSWDGAFYADLAQHGYGALPRPALRFFPLTPLLGRAVGWTGLGPRTGVVVLANLAALGAGVLLVVLLRREAFPEATVTRAVWLLTLAPSAFVLVFGYAEAAFLVLAIAAFLCARSRRWWLAVPIGLLAGLSRPSGFVVAVPLAVEGFRALRETTLGEKVARGAAVIAPFVGTALYLLWVDDRFGDGLLPFRVQTRANLKGAFTDPFTSTTDALRGMVHGHIGTGLHVPWMILVIALTVVAFRRLPVSYGLYAAVTVASAVTSSNLDSFERYALGAFPVVIALALVLRPGWQTRVAVALSAAAMTGYATLAFCHAYVP
jgi:hypothetical protein